MSLIKTFSILNNIRATTAIQSRFYSVVKPVQTSKPADRFVPDHIPQPDYAEKAGGIISRMRRPRSMKRQATIEIKTDAQIAGMRDACRVAKSVLDSVGSCAVPGVTTDELDRIAHKACVASGGYPSPLHYRGFPKSICTSVNNVACHGIPDDRALEDGDIVNIDVTVYYKGFHGDVSETFLIGASVDDKARHLVNVAKICRMKAISLCGPGQPFNIIGKTISAVAIENRCSVIPEFCGHGIGSFFHGPPDIIHVDNDLRGVMKEGMTFTIEPVICEGAPGFRVLSDGWTAVTNDDSRSAQFEHTILITHNGHEILTL